MSGDSARRVITPPNFGPVDGPLVYLAGPIEGAPDWQSEALERLLSLDPSLNVANPRRPLAPGEELASEQIDWETGYLRRAEQHGAILFWMAAERDHVPWRAYAQVARAQLFECKARPRARGRAAGPGRRGELLRGHLHPPALRAGDRGSAGVPHARGVLRGPRPPRPARRPER